MDLQQKNIMPKRDLFDNIILKEVIDIINLKILIENFNKYSHLLIKDKPSDGSEDNFKIYDPIILLDILKKYYDIKLTDKNIHYYYSNKGEGRMFSKGYSLQSAGKVIRHTISKKNYYDIDMKNAHPVLLLDYCKKNNIPTKYLDYYINNRDECLKDVDIILSNNDINSKNKIEDGKTLFLILLNGGLQGYSFEGFPDIVNLFNEELKFIRKEICKKESVLYERAKAKKYNIEGTTTNYLLCILENQVLQYIYQYCELSNIKVGALVFDGCMVYKDCFENDDDLLTFLDKLETYIFQKLNIQLKIVEKKMEKDIDLSEYDRDFYQNLINQDIELKKKELIVPETHEAVGFYILKQIENEKNIYYSLKKNAIYVYNENNKLFEEKPFDVIMNFVSLYMKPLIYKNIEFNSQLVQDATFSFKKKEDDVKNRIRDINIEIEELDEDTKSYKKLKNELKSLSKELKTIEKEHKDSVKDNIDNIKKYNALLQEVESTPFQKNVMTQIKNRIPDSDEFIESTFNKIPYLFAISDNKVINLRTLEVIERSKEHYFTYSTNNIFKSERPNKEWVYNYISELLKTNNKFFINSVLALFGYFMTGETCLKVFPILTGDGDNGKSAFFNVIKLIYGNFSIVGNEKVFLKQKSQAVHSDEYLPLVNKRFAYLQEIDKNSMFNEKLIKSITGNDGQISLRACGGRTIEVIIDCKLLCICNGNDIPDFIDKQGFVNRVLVLPFTNKFKRDSNKVKEIMSMKDDIFTELCYYVKEHFYDNNNNIEFSDEIMNATDDLKDNKDSIKQFMSEKIEITKNDKDRISKPALYQKYISFCHDNDLITLKVSKIEFYSKLKSDYELEIYRDREFKGLKERPEDLDEDFHVRLI